jgi:hypothetical protein
MRQRELIANVQAGAARTMAATLTCACMLLPQPARAQSDPAPGNRTLKAAVAKLVRDTGIKSTDPGIAVLAMRPGRVMLMDDGSLYGYGHDGYWEGFNTMYYNYLSNNHTVVLLSNRGHDIDLDEFWEKLSELIETHAKE